MTKYIVDLYLDGYPTQAEQDAAAPVFIYDQLNHAGSGVKVERYNAGWISVNDRLPPVGDKCLVSHRWGGEQKVTMAVITRVWDNGKKSEWWGTDQCDSEEVSLSVWHWMPLPLPPNQD